MTKVTIHRKSSEEEHNQVEAINNYLKNNVDFSKIIIPDKTSNPENDDVIQNVGLYSTVVLGSLIMVSIVFVIARVLYF